MTQEEQQLKELKEIRSLMDRSTRFLSLSGLSGVLAGIFALLGAGAAYFYLRDLNLINEDFSTNYNTLNKMYFDYRLVEFCILDAGGVLVAAVACALIFGYRKSKKMQIPFWSKASERLLINLGIPLIAGALYCCILMYHFQFELVPGATLLFYGLGLLNAGKYTLNEVRYLGISQIILGLVSSLFTGYGLLFWAIGFGLMHIVYGTIMYFKYEHKTSAD